MQVEGFYGNAPARVPAARITYVPSEGASGEDGFVFVATDGDLRSEHEVLTCPLCVCVCMYVYVMYMYMYMYMYVYVYVYMYLYMYVCVYM